MRNKVKAAAAATLVGVLSLSACSGSAGASSKAVSIVGFSVLSDANAKVTKDFQSTSAGKGVKFTTSYGASGDQSRAVLAGQPADEVHFSLLGDMTRLVDAGLVSKSWDKTPFNGICTQSVVVLVVRKGNPLHVTGWNDLTKPGVQIVTPNPASSGSAQWNLLAAYGQVLNQGGSETAAQAYLKKFFKNVVAMPASGGDSTSAFEGGTGNVLISYENEAILARQSGQKLDYVIPSPTLLIQNPCATTTDATSAAKAFQRFQISKKGQTDYAETGFRPLYKSIHVPVKGANDPANPFPVPASLMTINKTFGSWPDAATKYFDPDKGIITKIQAAAGVS